MVSLIDEAIRAFLENWPPGKGTLVKSGIKSEVKSFPIKAMRRFPGVNPSKAPNGFVWQGKPGSIPGSKDGNFYNPTTGESLRPDLSHPPGVAPHWAYKDAGGSWYRLFEDGTVVLK
jgi:hypothetical protein